MFCVDFFSFSYSQIKKIIGTVSDQASKPLEYANVIAKPLQEKASLKFAIAENKGRYRLELEKEVKYEIAVSYIGYIEEIFMLESTSDITSHDFHLKATGENLKEIVIKYEFKPIIVKKDTLVFDVNSFANGNERKMKESTMYRNVMKLLHQYPIRKRRPFMLDTGYVLQATSITQLRNNIQLLATIQ